MIANKMRIVSIATSVLLMFFFLVGVYAQSPVFVEPVLIEGTAEIIKKNEGKANKVKYKSYMHNKLYLLQVVSGGKSELIASSSDNVVEYYVKGKGPFYADTISPNSISIEMISVSPLRAYNRLAFLINKENLNRQKDEYRETIVYQEVMKGLERLNAILEITWNLDGNNMTSMSESIIIGNGAGANITPITSISLSNHDENGIPRDMVLTSFDPRSGFNENDFEVKSKISKITYPAPLYNTVFEELSSGHISYEDYIQNRNREESARPREKIVQNAKTKQGLGQTKYMYIAGGAIFLLLLSWKIFKKS